ncbi:MAG: MBL fold metallo-hydrolase [Deltaproteobacteria bacterium]|nr:MBL fold metallo-hydrolase [Deltaproteobacteria bacterium]
MKEPLIRSRTVGEYRVQVYLVSCPKTERGVIIDPAGQPRRLARWAQQENVTVTHILCTHGHPDHTLAAAELRRLLGAPLALHAADDDFFASPAGARVARGELGLVPPPRADLRLADGDEIVVGELTIKVLHTPGHTPGGVCYLAGKNLFTGDTLFVGAVGRTDLGGASLDTLLTSLRDKVLPLPGDTVIWPGHDYGDTPTSTLAREKEENPYITDFLMD